MKTPKDMTPEEKQEHLKTLEAEISKLEAFGRTLTLLRAMEWLKKSESTECEELK